MNNKIQVLTPVLTGMLSVFSVYVPNAERIGLNQLVVPLCYALIISLFFYFLFWMHPLTKKAAPIVSAVFTLCFFLWYMITPYTGIALLTAVIVLTLKIKQLPKANTPVLMVVSIALVVSMVMSLTATTWASGKSDVLAIADTGGNRPNVYFIIPDRMPSIDAMTESGIDSSEMVLAMRNMGFYVKENQMSHDTYTPYTTEDVVGTRTTRYLGSVLNMGLTVADIDNYSQLLTRIKHPSVISVAHSLGYEYISIGSWFTETASSPDADYNYFYTPSSLIGKCYGQEFAMTVWNTSIMHSVSMGKIIPLYAINEISRDNTLYQIQTIQAVAQLDRQHFVFMHMICPHPPYVWTAEGEPFNSSGTDEVEDYTEQIKFAEKFLVDMAEGILASDPTAVIIFQSDEGMAFHDPVELNYGLSQTQWNGVFTAWRIPGSDENILATVNHTDILAAVMSYLK